MTSGNGIHLSAAAKEETLGVQGDFDELNCGWPISLSPVALWCDKETFLAGGFDACLRNAD